MKGITIFGVIVGIGLIIASFIVPAPKREISNPQKYIGGDAYNYQIEASIKAGEIAGAKTARAIYLIGGILLLFSSLIANGISNVLMETKKITSSSNNSISGINQNNNSIPTTAQVNYGDTWTCKKCNEKNPITSSSCKGCGEYK